MRVQRKRLQQAGPLARLVHDALPTMAIRTANGRAH